MRKEANHEGTCGLQARQNYISAKVFLFLMSLNMLTQNLHLPTSKQAFGVLTQAGAPSPSGSGPMTEEC